MIPQHCYIKHNHLYISISETLILCQLACHCYLYRNGCVKCSNVGGVYTPCLSTLSVSACIQPFLHSIDFFHNKFLVSALKKV